RRTAPAAARTRVGNRSGGYAASAIADAEPILITRSGTADQNATIRSVNRRALRRPLERGLYAAIESHKHVFQAVTLDPSSGELAAARLPATREIGRASWRERV